MSENLPQGDDGRLELERLHGVHSFFRFKRPGLAVEGLNVGSRDIAVQYLFLGL